jgi:hypothetical protein
MQLGRVGPASIVVAGKVTWHHAAITIAGTLAINSFIHLLQAPWQLIHLFTCFKHSTTTVL